MAGQKVKVKVKKKKLKVKKLIITLVILIGLIFSIYYFLKQPLKNIYVEGNKLVSDKEIIELAGIKDYPPFIRTYFIKMKNNIKENKYIENVTIERKFPSKIYIKIKEYRPLFIYNDNLILSSKSKVDNKYNINYLPYVVNNIDKIYDKTIESFNKINDVTLIKISHIEYAPNEIDKERFIFYMNDGNYIYINLSTIEKINKYNNIVKELDGKKGIIYLDSGDYIEVKN